MEQGPLSPVPMSQTQPQPQPETPEVAAASRAEPGRVTTPQSGNSDGGTPDRTVHLQSSIEQPLIPKSEGHATQTRFQNDPYADFDRVPTPPPPPARSRDGHGHTRSFRRHKHSAVALPLGARNPSEIDWIVPVDGKNNRKTVGERLDPTIENAEIERDKYAKKALWTNWTLNIAIGLQVLLGALTTGIASAVTTVKQGQVSTAILGGLATLVASYLARARGSGEPELSITRVKDLEQFLRDARSFRLDHGHQYATPGDSLERRLDDLRQRFEELLGNASGERKLSPVGITATQTQNNPSTTNAANTNTNNTAANVAHSAV